jgi:hypothetical protein
MKRLENLLYPYLTIYATYILRHVLAVLDGMAPSLAYRPALQRVKTPVVPRVNALRPRSDCLLP